MRFFNSQNVSRGGTYDKVWFNYEGENSYSFKALNKDGDVVTVTANDFVKAKTRAINYSYAGSLHECSYHSVDIPQSEGGLNISWYLDTKPVTFKDVSYIMYDYANALFHKGMVIYSIRMKFVKQNDVWVVDTSGNSGIIYFDYHQEFDALMTVTDTGETSPEWGKPVIKPTSGTSQNLGESLAINIQTHTMKPQCPYLCQLAESNSSGVNTFLPLAWFIIVHQESIELRIVLSTEDSYLWDLDPTTQPYQHMELVGYSDEGFEMNEVANDKYYKDWVIV